MSLKTQKIDYFHIYKKYKDNYIFSLLMGFLSIFYRIAYKSRLLLYKYSILKQKKINIPIISIGNITTGGTGKTPLTIAIGNELINKGYKVGILSRGYKSIDKNNENTLVSDGEDIFVEYDSCGDEPYLIAKSLQKAIVLTGKNRVQTAKSALKLGANILILDDGYQHLKLNRDLNILLLDSTKPFDNGHILPKGELREDLESIKRANIIIFTNSKNFTTEKNNIEIIERINPTKKIFYMKTKIKNIKGINIKKVVELKEFKNKKILSFSGIGNPNSFKNSLYDSGINIVKNIDFTDHHNYTYVDIERITEEALKSGVEDVITTSKDAVKLEYLCEAAPITFWYTDIEIEWENNTDLENILSELKFRSS